MLLLKISRNVSRSSCGPTFDILSLNISIKCHISLLMLSLYIHYMRFYVRTLQCSNGHLMCAGCFTHVLADARLRDETATCPSCRVEISKTSATRNLAVENAVSELPAECQFCNKQFPRNSLERHEDVECEER